MPHCYDQIVSGVCWQCLTIRSDCVRSVLTMSHCYDQIVSGVCWQCLTVMIRLCQECVDNVSLLQSDCVRSVLTTSHCYDQIVSGVCWQCLTVTVRLCQECVDIVSLLWSDCVRSVLTMPHCYDQTVCLAGLWMGSATWCWRRWEKSSHTRRLPMTTTLIPSTWKLRLVKKKRQVLQKREGGSFFTSSAFRHLHCVLIFLYLMWV